MTTPDSHLAGSFVQARKFTRGPRTKGTVGLLVVHATAGKEVRGGAHGVATWFADPHTRDASAHYVVDDAEIVQCVRESDIAWGASHANHQGIHVEHVGLASQTPAQWDDVYSRSETFRSIALFADLCKRYGVPAVWLLPGDLLGGKRGITSHLNVDHAWPSTGHTDPGVGFPARWFVGQIAAMLAAGITIAPQVPERTLWILPDMPAPLTGAIVLPTGVDAGTWLPPDEVRARHAAGYVEVVRRGRIVVRDLAGAVVG